MHEEDVRRRVPSLPGVTRMVEDASDPVHLVLGGRVVVDPALQRLRQRRARRWRRIVRGGIGPAEQATHRIAVDVVALVPQGDVHVPRVTTHDDVRRPGVDRHSVEGRVRLDESTVPLSLQPSYDLVDRRDLVVDPRRQAGQRGREVRVLEDEQRADHLHPGGAALGPGGDHDVTVAEGELLPPRTVLVVGPVANRVRAHRLRP